jgi:hypothetical protein
VRKVKRIFAALAVVASWASAFRRLKRMREAVPEATQAAPGTSRRRITTAATTSPGLLVGHRSLPFGSTRVLEAT